MELLVQGGNASTEIPMNKQLILNMRVAYKK